LSKEILEVIMFAITGLLGGLAQAIVMMVKRENW